MLYATNIEWEVDSTEEAEGLPDEIEIPADMTDEEEISDYISDFTGFCHNGFALEERAPGKPVLYETSYNGLYDKLTRNLECNPTHALYIEGTDIDGNSVSGHICFIPNSEQISGDSKEIAVFISEKGETTVRNGLDELVDTIFAADAPVFMAANLKDRVRVALDLGSEEMCLEWYNTEYTEVQYEKFLKYAVRLPLGKYTSCAWSLYKPDEFYCDGTLRIGQVRLLDKRYYVVSVLIDGDDEGTACKLFDASAPDVIKDIRNYLADAMDVNGKYSIDWNVRVNPKAGHAIRLENIPKEGMNENAFKGYLQNEYVWRPLSYQLVSQIVDEAFFVMTDASEAKAFLKRMLCPTIDIPEEAIDNLII